MVISKLVAEARKLIDKCVGVNMVNGGLIFAPSEVEGDEVNVLVHGDEIPVVGVGNSTANVDQSAASVDAY